MTYDARKRYLESRRRVGVDDAELEQLTAPPAKVEPPAPESTAPLPPASPTPPKPTGKK